MEAIALAVLDDALWSLTVIGVVVGPPALLVAGVVWGARRAAARVMSRAARG